MVREKRGWMRVMCAVQGRLLFLPFTNLPHSLLPQAIMDIFFEGLSSFRYKTLLPVFMGRFFREIDTYISMSDEKNLEESHSKL